MSDLPLLNIATLETNNLREQATHVVRSLITTGQVKPGRIYPVSYFSRQLGVSATPVREALLDLVNDRLMETVKNRGFRVPTLSEHDLDELIDLRLMLEVPNIERVVAVMTPGAVERSRTFGAETVAAGKANDKVVFVESDMKFHLSLLEPLGNCRLIELLTGVKNQMCVYGLRPLTQSGKLSDSAAEHLQIIEAIARGDAGAATEAMRSHLLSIRPASREARGAPG